MTTDRSGVSVGGSSAPDTPGPPVRMKKKEFLSMSKALQTRLFEACRAGTKEDVIEALTTARTKLKVNLVNKTGPDGLLPLTVASVSKNVAAVEQLLLSGARVDAVNRDSAPALQHVAMTDDAEEVVSMLIAAGADPDKASHDGFSAVIVAVRRCLRSLHAQHRASSQWCHGVLLSLVCFTAPVPSRSRPRR